MIQLRPRAVAALAIALGASCSLTACLGGGEASEAASGYDDIVDAAADEGQLTWYTSIPEAVAQNVVKDFESKHDLTVETVVLTSGLLATRYSSEMESGKSPADVITLADPIFFDDAVGNDWIAPLDETDTPSLADWPVDAVKDDHYALVNIQPIGVTYDTTKASTDDFTDWSFLTDPAMKGEIYLVDPTNVPAWLANMGVLEDEIGDGFLSKLAAQGPTVVDSAVPGAQQVAAGSGTIVYPSLKSVSNPLESEGASVETAFPSPTTGVEQYAALSTSAPDPNAARVFLDYLLTEEAQRVLNADIGSSPLGDLPGTLPLPDGYQTVDFEAALERKPELLAKLGLD